MGQTLDIQVLVPFCIGFQNFLVRVQQKRYMHVACATMDENGLRAARPYGILSVHGKRPASSCRYERAQKTGIALSDRTTNCSIANGC